MFHNKKGEILLKNAIFVIFSTVYDSHYRCWHSGFDLCQIFERQRYRSVIARSFGWRRRAGSFRYGQWFYPRPGFPGAFNGLSGSPCVVGLQGVEVKNPAFGRTHPDGRPISRNAQSTKKLDDGTTSIVCARWQFVG